MNKQMDRARSTLKQRDKIPSRNVNNSSPTSSSQSTKLNGVTMNGNSYSNTSSPSSIASSSTLEPPSTYRTRTDLRSQLNSKRRYRNDRLFHAGHQLNRHYFMSMTNFLFQMQKDINKLKRRANRVDQILAEQAQFGRPIIRIPRLTKDELSAAENSSHVTKEIENPSIETNSVLSNMTPSNRSPGTVSSINVESTAMDDDLATEDENRYCSQCKYRYVTRKKYLHHLRKKHPDIFRYENSKRDSAEDDNSNQEVTNVDSVQSELMTSSDMDNDSTLTVVNHWDIGEGRLRPRHAPRTAPIPKNKVKCDVCHKFYRVEYIKKHKSNAHEKVVLSPTSEMIELPPSIPDVSPHGSVAQESAVQEIVNEPETVTSQENNNPPSNLAIAEMNVDDTPIAFQTEPKQKIVFATTCLEPYQQKLIEEFLQKFPDDVRQSNTIDSQTTHLIVNDNEQNLRSQLTLKFLEAIANHCYCVSFRWVSECVRYDRIVEEVSFEIEGDVGSLHLQGGPQRSRLKPQSLFHDIRFMIKCTENSETRMTNERLKNLVTACGGEIITCVTQKLLDTCSIVVLCDPSYVSERRTNYDQCRLLGINFVSPNWVVQSILDYRQKPFQDFEEKPL